MNWVHGWPGISANNADAVLKFAPRMSPSSARRRDAALTFAYALGVVKDMAGAFKWGFVATSAFCVIGIALAVVLGRMRTKALGARAA